MSDEQSSSKKVDSDTVTDPGSGLQYSATPGAGAAVQDAVRAAYERKLASNWYQTREAMQDSMLGLKELYNAIEKNNGMGRYIDDIDDSQNAYRRENLMSSRIDEAQRDYKRRVFNPLLQQVAKFAQTDADRAELDKYMMAKHGLERNALMRQKAVDEAMNADYSRYPNPLEAKKKALTKATEADYSGLTGLFGKDNAADAEDLALRFVVDYESSHAGTDMLWVAINNATKTTLRTLRDSGLMSEEQYNETAGMYKYYIPLRGWAETTMDEVYGYITRSNAGIRQSVLKKASGRYSGADDPIATIGLMGDNAIAEVHRRRIVISVQLKISTNKR